jgi:hypothetical protein
MAELAHWESFYVIVGSAAGALIGLQFVVMTLIAERPALRAEEAGNAFATPTIVHFGAALLLSAVLRAPWQAISTAAGVCGLIGLAGVAYVIVVSDRMRSLATYEPVFEDWFFHGFAPLLGYALLLVSALAVGSYTHEALFGMGTATLVLLFASIHNAWDAVSYAVLAHKRDASSDGEPK